ncbi:hypothetical protein [Mycobacterium attenuatum]|uniref:hypothetical protein n=1 Tax=Mycobacterium attenuatum TaxID=2341086 RepID=UPI000F18DAC7|nr:hypothetical protein [Mycobacterium attenuatum]VBA59310.1 hypothetical protein LAUMK41_03425 [Mycobacterium attenuatum]
MADATTDARMRTKLREQLGFLERSAAHFDSGHEDEALRLATTMRVLFHDTPQSTSLLSLLSMRNTTMLSTPRTDFADWRDFLNQRIDLSAAEPVPLIPKLGDQFMPVPFSTWWESDAVANDSGMTVARKRIVLGAANKDGGAHVDPKLQRFYENLAKGKYALGISGNLTYDGPAPFEQGVTIYPSNGHLALLRQFAHEVLCTAKHFDWLKSAATASTAP